jgi:putative membrane-bound dehydrogenase-like protein
MNAESANQSKSSKPEHSCLDPFQEKRNQEATRKCEFQGEIVPMILRHADLRRIAKDWKIFSFLALIAAFVVAAADFPAPYNSETGNPMSPQEALKAIKLPPGFKATLFAAEPDVQNPVAMAWDTKGRMWVAENNTYAEQPQHFDLSLKDRVIILEDKDWDGVAETRKVFTDNVQILTSVEVGHGGVWLMCPPKLLFIPDANHDDIPDSEPQVMLDGFTVAKDYYHNFANGLRFAPDGWLYGRCGSGSPGRIGLPGTPDEQRIPIKGGIWRYHPGKKIVEVLTHGTVNPWGHDWDANGELFFINTVIGHLWHLIHGAHLLDTGTSPPLIYERLDTIADHYHFDRRGNWQDSRDGQANNYGGGHAHVGMMIYQADQWPEQYRNKLFTLNFHGRRANVERLERNGSGYVGRHEPDVFFFDDPWFRGVEISTGPDGSGFVLDWSDTGECHEYNGVHRTSGRIYRISYGEPKKPEQPFAWRKPWPKADLNSKDEHARALAIRELVQFSPLDTIYGPLRDAVYPKLAFDPVKFAREDESSFVRLQLASTLQRLPLTSRAALAKALLSHTNDATDPFLPYMVWFGISPLAKSDPQSLVGVAENCTWPKTLRWIARSLATQPEALNSLLAQTKPEQLETVLEGMTDAFKGIRSAPKPAVWNQVAKSDAAQRVPAMVRDLSILFGDADALNAVKQTALDSQASLEARTTALQALIKARPADLRAICEQLLATRNLNVTAVRGLALFDDPAIGVQLAQTYNQFTPQERPTVIETLASRPVFARAMLAEMTAGKIPRADLSAFHARQIRAYNDEALRKQLAETWGEVHESAGDKEQIIAKLKADLRPEVLDKANLSQGRVVFKAACAACHTLYGTGGKAGPDLTGSGRANLDYLLDNIIDPSGVVSADYRMSDLLLKDDRELSGVITGQNDRTVTIRTMTESLTIDRAEIVNTHTSKLSMMPAGLLLSLKPDQIRDLIAYLMHPSQVPLPNE